MRTQLIDEANTVKLPTPERAANVSVETIDGKKFVKLEVEVTLGLFVTRVVRLSDVVAFHSGPYKDSSDAESPWTKGKRAKRQLEEGAGLTGFVAVSADSPVVLHVESAMAAADSLVIDEFALQPERVIAYSSTCTDDGPTRDRPCC